MAKPIELIQVVKWESTAGGGDVADNTFFPDEINADEDVVSAAGFSPQASGVQNTDLMIWREGSDMMFEDPTVGSGVSLQQLLEGSGVQGQDVNVKISLDDTTPGFLEDKLVAGSGINVTVLNDGGNEQLEISTSGESLPDPTCCGDHLIAIDGEFVPSLPLTSLGPDNGGWLMNDNGILMVVG